MTAPDLTHKQFMRGKRFRLQYSPACMVADPDGVWVSLEDARDEAYRAGRLVEARTTPLAEALAVPEVIAGRSLSDWAEFARRDDCLDRMVPSDLRQLVAALRAIGEGRADTEISADAEIGRGTASRITKGDVSPTSD